MLKAKELIREELTLFEGKFNDSVKSRIALLDRIMKYIVKRKGKQLRPMFVFLSAKLFGPVNDATYRAAALVELLHTASLVHDDVVDDSMQRRNFFSINALWKNKIAVLVGDYLLTKGLLLSLENKDFRVLQYFSDAVREISEGELLQLEKARQLNIKEETYFEIIRGKTASLLSSSCAAGAYTTSNDELTAERMHKFGENVGIAFQIKDDLFDYGAEDIGKPTGNDIKEKKLTLPLIYTLNNCDNQTRSQIIYIVKNQNRNKEKVKWVIDLVKKHGGIEYAISKMNEYRDKALAILNDMQQGEVNNALADLVMFTTSRKY